VTAVLVRSYGSGELLWPDLNANWSQYGRISVAVTRNDFSGVPITLQALEDIDADVVIISDPAGIAKHFTDDEVSALQDYANEGHSLIATFLTFYDVHRGHGIHNEKLAPLFGLVDQEGWFGGGSGGDTHTYARQAVDHTNALFRHLPDPYVSTGFQGSQKPPDGRWSDNDLAGAELAGLCPVKPRCAITLYRADAYDAIYVSNMPEYGGGTDDEQFLYNAITYSARTR